MLGREAVLADLRVQNYVAGNLVSANEIPGPIERFDPAPREVTAVNKIQHLELIRLVKDSHQIHRMIHVRVADNDAVESAVEVRAACEKVIEVLNEMIAVALDIPCIFAARINQDG